MKRPQSATKATQSPMPPQSVKQKIVTNAATVTENQTTAFPFGFLGDLSKRLDPWAPGGFYFYFLFAAVILFVLTLGLTVNVIEVIFNISVIAIMMASLAACYMVYKS